MFCAASPTTLGATPPAGARAITAPAPYVAPPTTVTRIEYVPAAAYAWLPLTVNAGAAPARQLIVPASVGVPSPQLTVALVGQPAPEASIPETCEPEVPVSSGPVVNVASGRAVVPPAFVATTWKW